MSTDICAPGCGRADPPKFQKILDCRRRELGDDRAARRRVSRHRSRTRTGACSSIWPDYPGTDFDASALEEVDGIRLLPWSAVEGYSGDSIDPTSLVKVLDEAAEIDDVVLLTGAPIQSAAEGPELLLARRRRPRQLRPFDGAYRHGRGRARRGGDDGWPGRRRGREPGPGAVVSVARRASQVDAEPTAPHGGTGGELQDPVRVLVRRAPLVPHPAAAVVGAPRAALGDVRQAGRTRCAEGRARDLGPPSRDAQRPEPAPQPRSSR